MPTPRQLFREQPAEYRYRCVRCLEQGALNALPSGMRAWRRGIPIKKALPDLFPIEREMLTFGWCSNCAEEVNKGVHDDE